MTRKFTMLTTVALLVAGQAFAGPVADFTAAYDGTYAAYRSALFATNSGDAGKAGKAMAAFDAAWAGLAASYAAAPPPQYVEDPLWGQTMTEVGALPEKAKTETGAGDLAAAHATLEGVRERLSALHNRNGVETFSDRMNAYHAKMEAVLGLDLTAKQAVLEHAAVLAYLAADVVQAPPAAAAGNADYAPLQAAFQASVDALVAAARGGDDAAIKAAVGGLKVPYSKFFLKFG